MTHGTGRPDPKRQSREKNFRETDREKWEILHALAEHSLSGFFEEEPDLNSAVRTARASESSLEKDWRRPEEDEAWKNL